MNKMYEPFNRKWTNRFKRYWNQNKKFAPYVILGGLILGTLGYSCEKITGIDLKEIKQKQEKTLNKLEKLSQENSTYEPIFSENK